MSRSSSISPLQEFKYDCVTPPPNLSCRPSFKPSPESTRLRITYYKSMITEALNNGLNPIQCIESLESLKDTLDESSKFREDIDHFSGTIPNYKTWVAIGKIISETDLLGNRLIDSPENLNFALSQFKLLQIKLAQFLSELSTHSVGLASSSNLQLPKQLIATQQIKINRLIDNLLSRKAKFIVYLPKSIQSKLKIAIHDQLFSEIKRIYISCYPPDHLGYQASNPNGYAEFSKKLIARLKDNGQFASPAFTEMEIQRHIVPVYFLIEHTYHNIFDQNFKNLVSLFENCDPNHSYINQYFQHSWSTITNLGFDETFASLKINIQQLPSNSETNPEEVDEDMALLLQELGKKELEVQQLQELIRVKSRSSTANSQGNLLSPRTTERASSSGRNSLQTFSPDGSSSSSSSSSSSVTSMQTHAKVDALLKRHHSVPSLQELASVATISEDGSSSSQIQQPAPVRSLTCLPITDDEKRDSESPSQFRK